MAVIGVTGLPGAGKSCAAEFLARGGGSRIDVDAVGHAILEEPDIRAHLRSRFGPWVVPDAAPVNRTALGQLVFSNPDALRALERIVHPPMLERVRTRIDAHAGGAGHVVVDAALLYRMGLDACCGRIVHVCAPFAVRLARVEGRGWDADMLRRRDGQLREIEAHALDADAVVQNDKTLGDLETTILHLEKEWQ